MILKRQTVQGLVFHDKELGFILNFSVRKKTGVTNFLFAKNILGWTGRCMSVCRKIRRVTTKSLGPEGRKTVLIRVEKKEQRERSGVQSTAPGALQAQDASTSALQKLTIQQPREETVDKSVRAHGPEEGHYSFPLVPDGFGGSTGFKLAFEE